MEEKSPVQAQAPAPAPAKTEMERESTIPTPKKVFQSPMESRHISMEKSGKKRAERVSNRVKSTFDSAPDIKIDVSLVRLDANAVRLGRKFVEDETGGDRGSRREPTSTIHGPISSILWPDLQFPIELHEKKPKRSAPLIAEFVPSPPSTPDTEIHMVEVVQTKPTTKGRKLLRKASAWALPSRENANVEAEAEAPPKIPPVPKRPPPPPPAAWCYHPPTAKVIKAAARAKLQADQVPPVPPLPSPEALSGALSLLKKASSPTIRPPFLKKTLPKITAPPLQTATKSHSQGHTALRPGLFGTATSPSVPQQSVKLQEPVVRRHTQRPALRNVVTTPAPRTILDAPSTPGSPLQSTFPYLTAQPTIKDLVAVERAQLYKDLPPLPPPRTSKSEVSVPGSAQTTIQSYTKANYCPPNDYGGNAFAQSGYWGSQQSQANSVSGAVDEANINNKTENTLKQGSCISLAKPGTTFSNHDNKGSAAKAESKIKPGSLHRTSRLTRKTNHKSNLDLTQHVCSGGGETLISIEFIPTHEIWKSLGRQPGQYGPFEHPFPDLDAFSDPAFQESYLLVRDAVIAYYLSPKTALVKIDPIASTASSQTRSTNGSKRPSAGRSWSSRESPFRHFPILSRKASATKDLTLLGNESHDSRPESVSSLPSTPKSRKKNKKQPDCERPIYDESYERAIKATTMVLQDIQDKIISKDQSMDIAHYMLTKPTAVANNIETWDEAEIQYINQKDINSIRQLRSRKYWAFLTDEIAATDSRFSINPFKGAYETILDQQRDRLKRVYEQRELIGLDVPPGANNLVWATMAVNWSEMAYAHEMVRYENGKRQMKNTKDLTADMALPRADKDSDDSDSSIGMTMKQYGVEKDVRASTYMNFPADIDYLAQEPKAAPKETPAERKRRHRLTQFNMGFQGPASPSEDQEFVKRRINAIEEEQLDWEQQLTCDIANEKARQQEREMHWHEVAKEAQWEEEVEQAEIREKQRQRDELEKKAKQQAEIHARYWGRSL